MPIGAAVRAHAEERRIPIVDQILRVFIPRKCFAELLRRPRGCRAVGHRGVRDAATLVREDDEYEQQAVGDRRDDEEIGGRDLVAVIGQEAAPRLRGRCGLAREVLRHRRPRDLHAQLQEFAVYPWGAPQRILSRHRPHQRAHVEGRHCEPSLSIAVGKFKGINMYDVLAGTAFGRTPAGTFEPLYRCGYCSVETATWVWAGARECRSEELYEVRGRRSRFVRFIQTVRCHSLDLIKRDDSN